ncbi:alpha/beta hydrolase [Sporolactobacillus shoreae]|uniref:Alpha/beta hydrolase n=1 Tax=Sporolactobacillus shoreae TaxID=1465501 RepID=A0A4Z0GNS8_9BACL|nr:alpha/beta fold hydrolase [Sporolactobacillus shoreae]TGA98015.1 alpha/beta hydrolase [Sporolactobacillus shoreae]
MEIQRAIIRLKTANTPAIVLTPENEVGTALVIHGYGGSKEEQLGLAFRIAETGLKTFVIDLRGHGENALEFDEAVLSDVQSIVSYCRSFGGKVIAIGHSLGGRLALISNADAAIGISPAICETFGGQTRKKLEELRHYRVNERSSVTLEKMLSAFPQPVFPKTHKKFVLFGSRDIPEIVDSCRQLDTDKAFEIKNALHSDIFTLDTTVSIIVRLIDSLYNKKHETLGS